MILFATKLLGVRQRGYAQVKWGNGASYLQTTWTRVVI